MNGGCHIPKVLKLKSLLQEPFLFLLSFISASVCFLSNLNKQTETVSTQNHHPSNSFHRSQELIKSMNNESAVSP
jgi:hypothetical protein